LQDCAMWSTQSLSN